MRYSSSMLAAIVICFFVFLGMSLLVTSPKYKRSTQIEMVDFSRISDMKKPIVKPDKPKQPPKKEVVKQLPVAPPLDVALNESERPVIEMPLPGVKSKEFDPTAFDISKPPGVTHGQPYGRDGDLQQMFQINPHYPQKALASKIEGWVEVEFTVNELGRVVNAKVIDSNPRRVFDNATIRALQKSKFKPMMVDGKPVAQKAVQIIEFKLAKSK